MFDFSFHFHSIHFHSNSWEFIPVQFRLVFFYKPMGFFQLRVFFNLRNRLKLKPGFVKSVHILLELHLSSLCLCCVYWDLSFDQVISWKNVSSMELWFVFQQAFASEEVLTNWYEKCILSFREMYKKDKLQRNVPHIHWEWIPLPPPCYRWTKYSVMFFWSSYWLKYYINRRNLEAYLV